MEAVCLEPANGAVVPEERPQRFVSVRREFAAPREYALVWRGALALAGLFARLGATVPARGFEMAYSPGFRRAQLGR